MFYKLMDNQKKNHNFMHRNSFYLDLCYLFYMSVVDSRLPSFSLDILSCGCCTLNHKISGKLVLVNLIVVLTTCTFHSLSYLFILSGIILTCSFHLSSFSLLTLDRIFTHFIASPLLPIKAQECRHNCKSHRINS